MTETELLTSRECAAWRRCSVRKLDRERAEGRGCPYVRIDGRVFYRRADVERFIEAHVRGGDSAQSAEPALLRRGGPRKASNTTGAHVP
jgi:hypothetical protein